MGIAGSIVVFVIAWWIAFQALLPLGVRSPAEEGIDIPGDPGAPTRPQLLKKGLWASLVAFILWAVIFSAVEWSGLSLSDLPSP